MSGSSTAIADRRPTVTSSTCCRNRRRAGAGAARVAVMAALCAAALIGAGAGVTTLLRAGIAHASDIESAAAPDAPLVTLTAKAKPAQLHAGGRATMKV